MPLLPGFWLQILTTILTKEWRRLFQATWRGMTSKIDHLRKSIEKQQDFIRDHVNLTQSKDLFVLRLNMLTEFSKLQDLRISTRIEFHRVRKAERDRQRDRIQHWLGSVDSDARHEDATKLRFTDTGTWLLEDHRFKQWFDPDHCVDPLLWLNGMPGAGL
jgi:hypothetical protein